MDTEWFVPLSSDLADGRNKGFSRTMAYMVVQPSDIEYIFPIAHLVFLFLNSPSVHCPSNLLTNNTTRVYLELELCS